jgi:SAM-dependent methyltransferase
VLDVGCGEQPLRERVEAAGASYVGLDVTQNASRTVAVVGSVLELPFDADRFDVVICSEVLEHVPEPRQALAEIARVLVPGGRLVLSTPFLYPLHESPYDYFRYTPFFYDYAAREVGLQLIESRKLGSALEAAATIADYALTPAPDASALLKLLGNAARIPLNAATGLIVWLLSLDEGRVTFTGIGAVLGKRRV